MPPFIVYALPRSRTYWLSRFLTFGKWHCYHDIVTDLHTIKDLQDFFATPYIGTCETGMVEGWRLAQALIPDARRVVIKRPVSEVKASLEKFGLEWDDGLYNRSRLLDEVSECPNVLTVQYDQLNTESTCKQIFEYCLGEPFDREWWLWLKDVNLQIDMAARIAKLERNRQAIESLKAEAKLRVA